MADVTFTIDFDSNGEPVLKNIKRQSDTAFRGVAQGSDKAGRAVDRLERRAGTLGATMKRVKGIVAGLAAALAIRSAVSAAVRFFGINARKVLV